MSNIVTWDEEIEIDCGYEDCDPKNHTYPPGWQFGGANLLDPSADPRWLPSTYYYYDASLKRIYLTQGPSCDEEAFDLFTWVASFRGFKPVYIAVRRPGETDPKMLPVRYDQAADTVYDLPRQP